MGTGWLAAKLRKLMFTHKSVIFFPVCIACLAPSGLFIATVEPTLQRGLHTGIVFSSLSLDYTSTNPYSGPGLLGSSGSIVCLA
jgi:hypothetical protein